MGLFKDLNAMSKQGRAAQANMNVGAMIGDGLTKMQAANEMIRQQTVNATMAVHGVATTAVVASVRPTGQMMNLAPVVEVDLTVFRGGVPVPMTHREPVQQVYLARLQPGATLKVKVDPADPASLWIDWTSP